MVHPELDVVRFTDPGLGNDAYLIVAGDVAVALDPARDVRRYVEGANERGARIVAAIDTHLHADFISGAGQLGALGADVYASATADLAFPHRPVGDGEAVEAGATALMAVATPGHSPEHLSFLVRDADPPMLFSGGALIPGGAARTDLLGEERTVELAKLLYRTLHERLADLPDETMVLPTHGGGSFCSTGGEGSEDRSTTLGFERKHNPLLTADSEASFVDALVSGYGLFPPYFLRLRDVNRSGPRVLDPGAPLPRLAPGAVEGELAAGSWLLDVRATARYARGHVRDSLMVPLNGGSFAVRLGWVVPWGTRLVLVADDEAAAAKAAAKAAGIGFEDVAGWVTFETLRGARLPVSETPVIGAAELAGRMEQAEPLVLLDVRHQPEWGGGTLPGATTVEFGALAGGIPEEVRRGPVVTYCATGARAGIAASLLERAGVERVTVFPGGPREWRASGRTLSR